MEKVVKTEYMNRPEKGFSEYICYDDAARESVRPVPGDRALMKNGDLYFCWVAGTWEKIGG